MCDPDFVFAAGWSNLYIPIPPTTPSHLSSCKPVAPSQPRTSSSRVSHGENDRRRVMMSSIKSRNGMVTFGNRQTILPASPHLLPSHTKQFSSTHLSPAQIRSERISDVSGHSYPLLSQGTLDRRNQEPLIDRTRCSTQGYGRGQSISSTPGLSTSVSESKDTQTAGILHPKDLIHPKTYFIPLTPRLINRPKPFDSSTTHPACLGTAISPISPRDSGDVRTIHPACAAFRSISVATLESSGTFDSSSIHPASIGSVFEVSPFTLDEEDQGDVRYFHPASIAFSTATSIIRHSSTSCAVTKEDSVNIDVKIVHPASINMSLPAPLSHPAHSTVSPPSNVQPVSLNVHPAFISPHTQNSLGPSESRYVHPASSSFKTFDASTIHPASVYSRPAPHQPTYHHSTAASSKAFGQSTAVLDHGDVRLSHPGWIGFGLAKPQRPKL